jgi:hypothetical protein
LLARRNFCWKGNCVFKSVGRSSTIKKAKSLGFQNEQDIAAIQICGPDKAGLGFSILNAISSAGINICGTLPSSIGKKLHYLDFL